MNDSILPVILSGGSGTRLWPLSRHNYPKQFLPLLGEHSLLQRTWQRVAAITTHGPLIIANEAHRFIVAEQLQAVDAPPKAIILEPVGRNTAPAIAIAALEARHYDHDPLLLILPSDHIIGDEAAFHTAVQQASSAALTGKLVTFGIIPHYAETGYGYIKASSSGPGIHPVECFVEKPDSETADAYLASGRYLWNSGMFLFKASCYLQELERFQPEMLAICHKAWEIARRDTDFTRVNAELFSQVTADSIDYAVMEKTKQAVVMPLDAGWNDIGSWTALRDISPRDINGNSWQGDVIALDCRNTYVHSSRLVTLLGLEDMVVVDTDDALLIGHARKMQHVKDIVAQLKASGRSETAQHRKVYRPWGHYDSIDCGPRFQVKRITVKPGASLSLQMHHHRAEHWIVVSGTAEVTRGSEVTLLSENQSTYIPLGVTHRMRNPGKLPLEMIEVQSGSYLGEDDIVRFDDNYGRS